MYIREMCFYLPADSKEYLVSYFFLPSQETEHMAKKQESSKEEEHCINPSVFQEYITGARLVDWQAHLLLFNAWLLTVSIIYATDWTVIPICSTYVYLLSYFFNSENDLEEVLTFYTHKNKSASVFLGTKVRSEIDASGEPVKCGNPRCELHPYLFHFFLPSFTIQEQ